MPELSRFFGITIRMYFDDHPPPHFHANYGGNEAQVGIDPIVVLGGELPRRAVSMVIEWAALHQQELISTGYCCGTAGLRARSSRWMKGSESVMFPRIRSVRHVRDYLWELEFTDGLQAILDFRKKVVGRGGVFAPLEDVDFFARVSVEPEAGTLVWPNDVDLDPDVLYSEASGQPLPVFPIADRT